MTTLPLPFLISSADLMASLAGQPIVAVQDEKTRVVEHWTPAGLPEQATCYIGEVNGRFLLYERTSALRFNTQRCTYPDSYTDHQGNLVLGQAQYLNPGNAEGFASVSQLKHFYEVVNPAFEAANPECLLLRTLVERLFEPTGMATVVKGYEDKGGRVAQGRAIW